METKQKIMRFFADQFETRERENGTVFTCLQDSRPDWCQDIARQCHDEMMPDDYRYQWISNGADSLADIEPGEWDESFPEIVDNMVSIYNHDLLQWVASNLNRVSYVDDAMKEGLPAENDLISAIQAGQYEEIRETLETLVSEIEEISENAEPYTAGFNMAGYMPDGEPVAFSEFDEAKEYILDELNESEELSEQNENEKTADQFRDAWFWVRKQETDFSIVVNGLCFWVSENPEWLKDL